MAYTITATNVNEAFAEVFWKLRTYPTHERNTRNGPAITFTDTFIITYLKPQERVLFHEGRDANPIFHLMESIWMLAGRNDVAFLERFNSRIRQYSDDGVTFNAAYGYRWRRHFGFDQLLAVIDLLRRDLQTRQAVVQIWDAADLTRTTNDKACNTQVIFETQAGQLDMTVLNRSNDIWWGALGANVVHFSVLQEFVATALQVPLGVYRQVSANLHLYRNLYKADQYITLPPQAGDYDRYWRGMVEPRPLMTEPDPQLFLYECEWFCVDPLANNPYRNTFLSEVARPMAMVSAARRAGETGRAEAASVHATDWRSAAMDWVERREAARKR